MSFPTHSHTHVLNRRDRLAFPSGMSASVQWFSPWEPQPYFCKPVADQSINERIAVTVRYAVQSGPAFLDMMKAKHQSDPTFAWLFAGEAYHYFRWSLFCAVHNLPVDQPPPSAPQAGGHMHHAGPPPMQHPPPMQPPMQHQQQPPMHMQAPQPLQQQPDQHQAVVLPPELQSGFTQVLEALSGSKVRIRGGTYPCGGEAQNHMAPSEVHQTLFSVLCSPLTLHMSKG